MSGVDLSLVTRNGKRVPTLGWAIGVGALLALLVLVHVSVGWRAMLSPWSTMRPGPLVAALLLVLLSYAVRTVRVYRYFDPATSADFPGSFRLVLLHNLFNNLLPMRSGEASFPILMKRDFGVPFLRSVPGLVYLRLLDLHFLVVLGCGLLLPELGALAWGVSGLLLPIPYLAYLLQGRLGPLGHAQSGPSGRMLDRALAGLPRDPAVFWEAWLWTGVNWLVKLLVFAWILGTFAPLPFGAALLGSVTGEVSSVLPVHGLAGAGTYEAGVVIGLLWCGV